MNDSTAKFNTILRGGDIDALALNITSGDGTVNALLHSINGLVNISAGSAHVLVDSGDLQLGELHLSGDPTFYNTTGNIFLRNDLNFPGQNLAIVATGDIISQGAQVINTSSFNFGGSLTLIAGAAFTTSGDHQIVDPGGPPDTSSTITIVGPNTQGGKIDLASSPITAISTVGGFNAGGNVLMVAYGGSAIGSGRVALPDIPLTTGSGGTDINGNVTIIAMATTGTAIRTGAINASGATNGTGAIYLLTGLPIISGSSIQIVDGKIVSGSYTVDPNAVPFGNSAIATGDITSSGAAINLIAGNNITAGAISTIGRNGSGVNGGVNIRGLDVTAGDVTTGGGKIAIVANGVLTLGDVLNNGANSQGLNGGIQLVAGAASGLAVNVGDITTSGATRNSGNILVVTSAPSTCITCALVNRQTDTQGAVKVGNVNSRGSIDLRAGGDMQAGTLVSNSFSAFGGNVQLLSNNNNATSNQFLVGGSGSNSVTRIDVNAGTSTFGSSTAGSISITSGGAGGLKVVDQAALNYGTTPNPHDGGGLRLTATIGELETPGNWHFDAVQTGNGGSVQLSGDTIKFTSSVDMSANAVGSGNGGRVAISGRAVELPQANLSANAAGPDRLGGVVSVTSSDSITVNGNVAATATGSFSGGRIEVNSVGSTTLNASVDLNASAQNDGFAGGFIEIGAGRINLGASQLKANATGINDFGGKINVNTGSGAVTGTTGSMTLAASSENGQGGSVTIQTGDFNTPSGLAVRADSQTGFGGAIDMKASSLNAGSSPVVMTANGGTGGGRITAITGGDLNLVPGSVLDASASSATGDGGDITLTAGNGSPGTLTIGGIVRADAGSVEGNGGIIRLTHASTNAMNIAGTVSADGSGIGASGHITYRNLDPLAPLAVVVSGTASAAAQSGIAASHEFQITGSQDLSIEITGLFDGPVSGVGARSIDISAEGANATLHVKELSTLEGGDITIVLTDAEGNSGVEVDLNGTLKSGGSLTVTANRLQNLGEIQAVDDITFLGLSSVTNSGNISTSAANANVLFQVTEDLRFFGFETGSIRTTGGGTTFASFEPETMFEFSGTTNLDPGNGLVRIGAEQNLKELRLAEGAEINSASGALITNAKLVNLLSNSSIVAPILSVGDQDETLTSVIRNNGTLHATAGDLTLIAASGVLSLFGNGSLSSSSAIKIGSNRLSGFTKLFIGEGTGDAQSVTAPITEIWARDIGARGNFTADGVVNIKTFDFDNFGNMSSSQKISVDLLLSAGESGWSIQQDGTLKAPLLDFHSGGSIGVSQSALDGTISAVSENLLADNNAGSVISIVSTGKDDLLLDHVTTQRGSLSVIAHDGAIVVAEGGLIAANLGNVLLQSENPLGRIALGPNCTISAIDVSPGTGGNIQLVVGPLATVSGAMTIPGITVTGSPDRLSIAAGSYATAGTNTIAMNGGSVLLNAGQGSISFEGGVLINATYVNTQIILSRDKVEPLPGNPAVDSLMAYTARRLPGSEPRIQDTAGQRQVRERKHSLWKQARNLFL